MPPNIHVKWLATHTMIRCYILVTNLYSKTMKKTQLMITCLAAVVTLSTHADAQRARPGGPARPGVRPGAATAGGFDIAELGAIKDKFIAFRKAVYEGDRYYTDKDIELRRAHAGMYMLTVNSLVEDRIREDAGAYYIEQLFLIAEDAKKQRGSKDALEEYQSKKIKDRLEKLRKQLNDERADKIDEKIQTPSLNRTQVLMEEVLKFGQDEKILGSGEASSIRRKMNNLSRTEQKAKSDKQVSDDEREKLVEESRKVWRELIEQLAD